MVMTNRNELRKAPKSLSQLAAAKAIEELRDSGFVPDLIKAALERGLHVELTEHLGSEKGNPEARFYPNSRNGFTPKTVSAEVGELDLDTPRDRGGSFIPRLVPKGSRRLGGLDDMIISRYADGMTVRDPDYRTLHLQDSQRPIETAPSTGDLHGRVDRQDP